MNNIKYFCFRCKLPRAAETELKENKNSTVPLPTEIVQELPNKKDHTKKFIGKKLKCGHFVSVSEPGFTDLSSEALNEYEAQEIRNQVTREMIGKTNEDIEQWILYQVEQAELLRKLANKKDKQMKYKLMQLEQAKERYINNPRSPLSPEQVLQFQTKFDHYSNVKPLSEKAFERMEKERTEEDKRTEQVENVKQQALKRFKGLSKEDLEAMKAMFKK